MNVRSCALKLDPRNSTELPATPIGAGELLRDSSNEHAGSSTPPESLKRQYDAKLKEVMEKAREHAKKIAGERDELKRQNEEKDVQISQLTKQMSSSTVASEEFRKLQGDFEARDSLAKKLEAQLVAMERHYTKPSEGLTPIASFKDWIFTKDRNGMYRWWMREVLPVNFPEPALKFDEDQLSRLQSDVSDLKRNLSSKEKEFDEYRNKVNIVLQEKEQPQFDSSALRIEFNRKLIKVESELDTANQLVTKLNNEIAILFENKKSDSDTITTLRKNISMQESLVEKMKISLKEHVEISDRKIATLEKLCDSQNQKLMKSLLNSFTQTDTPVLEVSLSISTPPVVPVMPVAPPVVTPPVVSPPVIRPALPSSSNDQVAIPLRAQIRDLLAQIDAEVHQHSLTRTQLDLVKSELRKIETAARVYVDLQDEVKVEYMRNVARRFAQLLPPSNNDELEQIIPVILSFFQISSDETATLLAQRCKPKTAFSLW